MNQLTFDVTRVNSYTLYSVVTMNAFHLAQIISFSPSCLRFKVIHFSNFEDCLITSIM